MAKRTHMAARVSVLDALLCRILAWGAVGFDMSAELDDARLLAAVLDPQRDAIAYAQGWDWPRHWQEELMRLGMIAYAEREVTR